MSPDLSGVVGIRDTVKQLHCDELGTLYRALSSDAPTAYGLSPIFTVHDELGQVRGPRSELYEALETASAAQDSPLSIVISTQSPTDADLLSVLIDDAKTGKDPRRSCSCSRPTKRSTRSARGHQAGEPGLWRFSERRGSAEPGRGRAADAVARVVVPQPDPESAPALRELESGLLHKKVRHGNHPVLTMCAHNAVVQKNPAGDRKLAKDKSTGRIDGMVSLTMAVGVAGTALHEVDIGEFLLDPIIV
jgi:phage terminase large subunit-like protein